MPAPDGPQFIRLFHSSRSDLPPHEVEHPDKEFLIKNAEPYTNQHPDIIHVGTRKSAEDISKHRSFLHEYEIDLHEAYPTTFGDERSGNDNTVDAIKLPETEKFKERMSGVQPSLFETISGTPDIAIKSNRAVPYRNELEDEGSVSFMIPKGAVGKGVRYVGAKYVGIRR